MQPKWIAFRGDSQRQQGRKPANHLSRRQHKRIDLRAVRFHQDVSIRTEERTHHEGNAAQQSAFASNCQLIGKDNRYANKAQQHSNYFLCGQALIGKIEVGDYQAEGGKRRLQHGGETRRNALLAPKH